MSFTGGGLDAGQYTCIAAAVACLSVSDSASASASEQTEEQTEEQAQVRI